MRTRGRPSGVVAIVILFLAASAAAQVRDTASMYGSVRDQQDAVVPGARVTLTSTATTQARTGMTDETGAYVFSFLPVGTYAIRIEVSGFQTYEQKGIRVQANENARVDVRLQIGAMEQIMTVDASAALVESRASTLKETIDERRISELPLNGRNPADLALLTPGIVSGAGDNRGDTYGRDKRPRGTKQLTVNGSRNNNLRYTLDGGENMDPLTNFNNPFPFPDAVQEFSVQTATTGGEVGNSSAGALNVVTKSGTNELHGNVFWFLRNTALNARNFFSNQEDQLKRNQLGFTLGGPVIKNKLFAFGGFQRTWVRTAPGDFRVQTLTAAERAGDFSAARVRIHDPLTGDPFPNNMIPRNRLSPAALNLLTVSPLPGSDGFTRFSFANPENANQYIGRADYLLSQRHTLMFRYFEDKQDTPFKLADANNIHSARAAGYQKSQNATLGHNFTPNATTVVHTQFSGNHLRAVTIPVFPKGIRDFGVDLNPNGPHIDIRLSETGVSFAAPHDGVFARASEEFVHDWSWTRRSHNLSWGLQLGWRQYNEDITWRSSGAFEFDGHATGSGAANGYDRADFMLGAFSFFNQNSGEKENRRQFTRGFYIADTWRLNQKLTLTLGLRYEPSAFYTDTMNRLQTFHVPSFVNGVRTQIFKNAPPGLFYPGDKRPEGGTFSDSLMKPDNNNLAPRLGIAWDPFGNGKTAIRAAYGIYYDAPPLWGMNNYNNITPFSYSVEFDQGSLDRPFRGRENLNRFPVTTIAPDSPYPSPLELLVLDDRYVAAYAQNWHLTLERELLRDTRLRIAYVGSKGTHLLGEYDQNPPIYNPNLTLAQNRADINGRRRIPGFQSIGRMFFGLSSSYNSLQVSVDKRYSNGVTVLGSYTWSKTLDYVSTQNYGGGLMVSNPFNFFARRGLSNQDRTHRLVTSFVWDLPTVSSGAPRAVRAVTRDWRVSGIVTAHSGRTFTINASGNPVAGAGLAFVDLVGTGNPVLSGGRSKGEKIARYFDTTRFRNPAPNSYGSLGRNALRGPGFANFDFSATRGFPIRAFGEAGRGEFRFEAFNLFNATHLALPIRGLTNPSFGQITGTDGDPRILQFAIKFFF
ncbi:MAG: TonB-dependent receptor [Acidobacteria bacterium]|nr:TonB-dependent receptor [Acidobacteriota bacterium]